MNPMLNVAIQAIREGGKIILKAYDQNNYIIQSNKNYHIALLNNTIYKSEKKIISIILKFFPQHIILKKNSNLYDNAKSIKWYIQAVNGTHNFIRNFPYFCLSISLYVKNQMTFSVIYNPIQNELFTTIKGGGVKLNGYKIRCNNIFDIQNSIIAVSFLSKKTDQINILSKLLKQFLKLNIKVRITGCNILDVAHLSCGKINYIIDLTYNEHNNNLLQLYTIESGGFVEDLEQIINKDIKGMIYVSNNQYIKLLKNIII